MSEMDPTTVARADRRAAMPHAGKFWLVYLALAAALAGVVGLGVHTATGIESAQKKKVTAGWQPKQAPTTIALSRSIARHYTALKLKGFEPKGSPVVEARRAAELKISGLQIPVGNATAQLAIPPTDLVYEVCGLGKECAFVSPPTSKRELLLRRLALGIVVDTFSSSRAPKHALVLLPGALVFYGRDEFSDASLRTSRALLTRLGKAKHPSARDVRALFELTNGSAFELAGQVVTEDQQLVLALKPRPCMDAACPGGG
jgi:hypothetical protein